MKQPHRYTSKLAVILSVLMLLSAICFPVSGATFMDIREERFLSEEAALTWQADVEADYALRDDGYAYTLDWNGPHRRTVAILVSELIADGEAVCTQLGPYATQEQAQAALEAERLAEPSLPERQIAFSQVFALTGESGYGFTKTVQSYVRQEYTREEVHYQISYTASAVPAVASAAADTGAVVLCCTGEHPDDHHAAIPAAEPAVSLAVDTFHTGILCAASSSAAIMKR